MEEDFNRIVVTLPPQPASELGFDIQHFYFNLGSKKIQIDMRPESPHVTFESLKDGPLLLDLSDEESAQIKAIVGGAIKTQRPDLKLELK